MSVEAFIVNAEPRNDEGKGASRRLRRAGKVPAVIYGGNKPPQSITLAKNVIWQQIENEAFFSHILTVKVDGEAQKAVVKDMQLHAFKQAITHMDFQRVDENSVIRVSVPLHFMGEEKAPGVKAGGVITHQMTSVEVNCPAGKLPEYLEADVSGLDVGDSMHLSQLKLPEGVELVELMHGEEHDLPFVTVVGTRGAAEEEEEAAAPEEGAADAE